MEKKPSDSNSHNIFENLCGCFRRSSHHHQDDASPATTTSIPSAASVGSGAIVHPSNRFQYTDTPEKKKENLSPVDMPIHNGEKVDLKIEPDSEIINFLARQREKLKNKAEVAPEAEQGNIVIEGKPAQETTGKVKEMKRTKTEVINDKVTDYIGRTKLKMRSMSSFSGGMSSFSGGKSASFK